jgi:hypothetical protein
LLDKGFFEATRKCLGNFGFGPYSFETAKERYVAGGSSKVDYIFLINSEPTVLCEAESPLVMMKVSELLPPHGIELKWVPGQSMVPKILSKVSVLSPARCNICFKEICEGRIVPGLETHGMVVSYLPQLLDCVPSCEG